MEEAEEVQDSSKPGSSNNNHSKVILECTRFSNSRFCLHLACHIPNRYLEEEVEDSSLPPA